VIEMTRLKAHTCIFMLAVAAWFGAAAWGQAVSARFIRSSPGCEETLRQSPPAIIGGKPPRVVNPDADYGDCVIERNIYGSADEHRDGKRIVAPRNRISSRREVDAFFLAHQAAVRKEAEANKAPGAAVPLGAADVRSGATTSDPEGRSLTFGGIIVREGEMIVVTAETPSGERKTYQLLWPRGGAPVIVPLGAPGLEDIILCTVADLRPPAHPAGASRDE
jgi:hypothetical protein